MLPTAREIPTRPSGPEINSGHFRLIHPLILTTLEKIAAILKSEKSRFQCFSGVSDLSFFFDYLAIIFAKMGLDQSFPPSIENDLNQVNFNEISFAWNSFA
jgi:hypothetical protein